MAGGGGSATPTGMEAEGIGVLHPGPWCVWKLGLHLPVVTLQEGFDLGSGPVYFLVSKEGSYWTKRGDIGSSFLLNLGVSLPWELKVRGQLTPSGPWLASTCWDHQVTGLKQGLGRTGSLEDIAVKVPSS